MQPATSPRRATALSRALTARRAFRPTMAQVDTGCSVMVGFGAGARWASVTATWWFGAAWAGGVFAMSEATVATAARVAATAGGMRGFMMMWRRPRSPPAQCRLPSFKLLGEVRRL